MINQERARLLILTVVSNVLVQKIFIDYRNCGVAIGWKNVAKRTSTWDIAGFHKNSRRSRFETAFFSSANHQSLIRVLLHSWWRNRLFLEKDRQLFLLTLIRIRTDLFKYLVDWILMLLIWRLADAAASCVLLDFDNVFLKFGPIGSSSFILRKHKFQ